MVFVRSMRDCRLIHRVTFRFKEQGRWSFDPKLDMVDGSTVSPVVSRSKADGRWKQYLGCSTDSPCHLSLQGARPMVVSSSKAEHHLKQHRRSSADPPYHLVSTSSKEASRGPQHGTLSDAAPSVIPRSKETVPKQRSRDSLVHRVLVGASSKADVYITTEGGRLVHPVTLSGRAAW